MHILAAGSLRAVWQSLMACYQEKDVLCDFGPAGLLRERIEAGEPCDFFASANMAHPQALLDAGRAQSVAPLRAIACVLPCGRMSCEKAMTGYRC